MSILRRSKTPRTRSCTVCAADISLHKASHRLCRRCWSAGRELVTAKQQELNLEGGGGPLASDMTDPRLLPLLDLMAKGIADELLRQVAITEPENPLPRASGTALIHSEQHDVLEGAA